MTNSKLSRLCVVGICSLSFVALGCLPGGGDSDGDDGGQQDTFVAKDTGEPEDTAEIQDTSDPADVEDQQDASDDQDASGQDASSQDASSQDVSDQDAVEQDTNGGGNEELGWAVGDIPAAGEPTEIADVVFVNDTEGWLVITREDEDNAGVWYTDDGGKTWTQRHSGQDPQTFAAASESGPFWFGTFKGDYQFWSSSDGKSFAPVRNAKFKGNPRYPDAEPEFGAKETADQIYFFDDKNGLFTSTSAASVQYTEDGGKTWYKVDIDTDAGGVSQLGVVGKEIWMVGGISFGNDPGKGAYVVRSKDRGKTWKQVHSFTDNAHDFAGGAAQALHIADDKGDEIWVGGEKRQLYFTKDGASSWNQIKGISDKVETIWNLDGAGDLIVGVVNTKDGSGILQSEDGGQTWKLVVNSEDRVFYDVEVVNEELAFAYPGDGPGGKGHWLVFDYHNPDDLIEIK